MTLFYKTRSKNYDSKSSDEDEAGTAISLTHCIPVDSSTVICWMSPFVILGVSGLFCRFYSIFDRKSCKQTV